MRTARGFGTVGAALLLAVTSGCALGPGTACPAVGYTNTVELRLEGAEADRVARIAYCSGAGCTPTTAPSLAPSDDAPLAPSDAAAAPRPGVATPAAPPTGTPGPAAPLFPATEHDGDVWRIVGIADAPAQARVALLDERGGTLRTAEVTLRWTRVGGSEQCGGPSTARARVDLDQAH